LANLGLVSCLAGAGAAIFMDRLDHASLIDGARLAGARIHRYAHGDPAALDTSLATHGRAAPRRVVLTESVFSMDGDIVPLAELARVCARHGAWLVVDEAHAVGVFGPQGSGCWPEAAAAVADLGVPLARVGTLSKALGSYGGFVAGTSSLVQLLVNRARGFIYSTGLAPACLGAATAALDIVEGEPDLGPTLLARAAAFRAALESRGLRTAPSASHIVPVAIGDNVRALSISRALEARGILCTAVRPPTVPVGTARLRFSISLGHTGNDVLRAAATVADVLG
jgi:8-amino-7-oxononanoate synthase